jgi:RimJ/RimL family protein N-acetyltransferase
MTLLENVQETYRESSIPVLETERLVLRAPRLEDAKAVVALASDRRVGGKHGPHPLSVPDVGCPEMDHGRQRG